jgi:beta-galactosidase
MSEHTICLSGAWDFRLDPADEGVAQQWYADPAERFPAKITVPGAWNAQGFGYDDPAELERYEARRQAELAPLRARRAIVLGDEPEAERVYHVFPGPAWYRTTAVIPAEWAGLTTSLVFTGVHRSATVWIDGRPAATHRSYLSPLTICLDDFAAAGAAITIVVRVDARRDSDTDPLLGCLDTLDFVHTEWGGIHHHVRLEATGPDRIDDVLVVPRLSDGRVDVTATAHTAVTAEVENAAGEQVGRATASPVDGRVSLAVPLTEVRPWTPETPYLYRLRLTAGDAVHELRFGLRELTVDGDRFLLNGRSFFLRGYGDDCIFPDTIAPSADLEEYRRRLRIAREYGFNYVRLHSWVPPEEYLDAADEVGLLVQPEFPLAGWHDVPATPAARAAAVEQWCELIRRYRNHASVAVWCMGNELYHSFDQAAEMYRLAKQLDPTRLVIESDGSRLDAIGRPTLDFVSAPFAEPDSIGFGDGKYELADRPTKPVVAHEAGYLQTLPDPADLDRFGTGLSPYWLRRLTERLASRDGYAEHLDVSRRLQATCLKANLEAARRSGLAGISVWLLQDYPNCAEGVLDMFYRPKSLTAAEFRRFNAPTVLLLDGDRNLTGGQRLRAELLASSFEADDPPPATVRWTLRRGDQVLAGGQWDEVRVPAGVHQVGTVEVDLPELPAAARLTLDAELSAGQLRTRNAWDLWLYPRNPGGARVGCTGGLADLLARLDEVEPARLGPGEPLLAERMTAAVRGHLDRGGRVLLLDPDPLFTTEPTGFRPASWDGSGHFGLTFDQDHPALRAMPAEGWCDLQFHSMLQGSRSVLLDQLPVEPIITCIDAPTRMARRSHLFEVGAGAGGLLVCGLDLTGAIRAGDPAAAYLLDRLLDYLSGPEFQPADRLDD